MAVDLALAKQHLRVTHAREDTLITQYIAAAKAMIEKRSGVLLDRREVTQRFSAFTKRLPLFWGPDPENVLIVYFDAEDEDQEIADARIVRDWLNAPVTGWPSIYADSVIEISYTAGFTEVPADLVTAQLLLIGHWYVNREAVGDVGPELLLGVDALIQPYRRIML